MRHALRRSLVSAVAALFISAVAIPVAAQGGAGPVGGIQGAGRGRQAGPAKPAPRAASGPSAGRALLSGADAADKGVWLPVFAVGAHIAPLDQIPFQPWARALYDDRRTHALEPHTRCKASGVARQFQTPYGVEIVEMPEIERIYVFDVGGPHTYRTVYMDGRTHPANLAPAYYGHSIGWWEGDTLFIDSVGFNEGFWMDRRGLPSTEQLHTLEKLTRTDQATIAYELTVDDPGAYTRPFSGKFTFRWEPGTELFEYICQEANYEAELPGGMGGQYEGAPPPTPFLP